MNATGEQAQQVQQRALEQASTNRVMSSPALQGGAVCVWDAFGEYWCENRDKSKRTAGSGYVETVIQQGQTLVYEGFCGGCKSTTG
jgi:hypothetical protein